MKGRNFKNRRKKNNNNSLKEKKCTPILIFTFLKSIYEANPVNKTKNGTKRG